MFGKWLTIGGIVAVSLVYGSKAQTQDKYCPPGYVSVPFSGGINCIDDGNPKVQPAPDPAPVRTRPIPPGSTEYGNGYIAVAWHPSASDVWASWNDRTYERSQVKAFNACTQAMGKGCKILASGWNISVAIARDKDNVVWYASGDTPDNARKSVIESCKAKKEGCKVVNTFTAEKLKQPKILDEAKYKEFLYDSAYDVSKMYPPNKSNQPPTNWWGFFAVAWLGGEQTVPLSNVIVASGFPNTQAAQKAALSLCKAHNRQTCLSLNDADLQKYPMFGIYLNSKNQMQLYSKSTAEEIEKSAVDECKKSGLTCQKVGIFDVRRADVYIHDRLKK